MGGLAGGGDRHLEIDWRGTIPDRIEKVIKMRGYEFDREDDLSKTKPFRPLRDLERSERRFSTDEPSKMMQGSAKGKPEPALRDMEPEEQASALQKGEKAVDVAPAKRSRIDYRGAIIEDFEEDEENRAPSFEGAEAGEQPFDVAQVEAATAASDPIPQEPEEVEAYTLSQAGAEESVKEAPEETGFVETGTEETGAEASDAPLPTKSGSFWSGVRDWVLPLVIAVALALVIRMFIGGPTTVKGESMESTLHNGDILLVSKIPTYSKKFRRADIIIMDSPSHVGEFYVKRIIGLPGEQVEIKEGHVFINNKLMKEYYIRDLPTTTYQDNLWRLKDNEYFVLGDNREPNASSDSRSFGPVPQEKIEGVARFRIFPLSRLASFY